jgi:hypothetical protein
MIGPRFAPNVQYTQKSFWAHPMELLGDVGQVEARFDSLRDNVKLGEMGARFVPNIPWAWKSFWA